MTRTTTVQLSSIAGEIEREWIDEADALAPGDEDSLIIVAADDGSIVDGFHRTAGYLRWAREQGVDPADVEIRVVECDDVELVAAAAVPGPMQETALEDIYAAAGLAEITARRYEVRVIREADYRSIDDLGRAVYRTADASEASQVASQVAFPYGAAIVDTEAETIDWGDRVTGYEGAASDS